MDACNAYLPEFKIDHNARFAIGDSALQNVHRALLPTEILYDISTCSDRNAAACAEHRFPAQARFAAQRRGRKADTLANVGLRACIALRDIIKASRVVSCLWCCAARHLLSGRPDRCAAIRTRSPCCEVKRDGVRGAAKPANGQICGHPPAVLLSARDA